MVARLKIDLGRIRLETQDGSIVLPRFDQSSDLKGEQTQTAVGLATSGLILIAFGSNRRLPEGDRLRTATGRALHQAGVEAGFQAYGLAKLRFGLPVTTRLLKDKPEIRVRKGVVRANANDLREWRDGTFRPTHPDQRQAAKREGVEVLEAPWPTPV